MSNTQPTAGAVRAAKQIGAHFSPSGWTAAAEIIDRETSAAELLEALKRLVGKCEKPFSDGRPTGVKSPTLAELGFARAAIAKAEGRVKSGS